MQRSLFATGDPTVRREAPFERIHLDDGAWLDTAPAWVTGADGLFEQLLAGVDWRQGRRWMYDRMVEDPRMSRWFGNEDPLPHRVLAIARTALDSRYRVRFGSVGLNLYRDGRDSVAFHRDRELRHLDDTLVAIVNLGGSRPFVLRPLGGGPARHLRPSSGDLIVMGGACQARWEHSVPKVAAAYPRISVSYRWSSGRGRPTAAPRRRTPRPSV